MTSRGCLLNADFATVFADEFASLASGEKVAERRMSVGLSIPFLKSSLGNSSLSCSPVKQGRRTFVRSRVAVAILRLPFHHFQVVRMPWATELSRNVFETSKNMVI